MGRFFASEAGIEGIGKVKYGPLKIYVIVNMKARFSVELLSE